jgi:hypothetical protein
MIMEIMNIRKEGRNDELKQNGTNILRKKRRRKQNEIMRANRSKRRIE